MVYQRDGVQGEKYKPLRLERAYSLVVNQIVQLIHSGQLQPGEQLPPERLLSRKLGVSRPSIREAFAALELLGIIHSKPGSGTYVKADCTPLPLTLSPESLTQQESPYAILESRRALESECARLAAMRASPDDIGAMTKALEAMQEGLVSHGYFEMRHDREFHMAVAKSSNSPILEALTRLVLDFTRQNLWLAMRDKSQETPELASKYQDQHRRILDSIEKRDPGLARQKMIDHLSDVKDDIFDIERSSD